MWPWQVPLAVGGLAISSVCAPKLNKTLVVWLKDKLNADLHLRRTKDGQWELSQRKESYLFYFVLVEIS